MRKRSRIYLARYVFLVAIVCQLLLMNTTPSPLAGMNLLVAGGGVVWCEYELYRHDRK